MRCPFGADVAAAVALFSLQHSVAAWKTSCLKRKGERLAEADGRETPDATAALLHQPGLQQLRGSAEHAQVRESPDTCQAGASGSIDASWQACSAA